jgi:3-phosphoshikimate 1-carboxyvinyltransferase
MHGGELLVTGGAAPLAARIVAPSDKSITLRALLLASLVPGGESSIVEAPLHCDDATAMRTALAALGARFDMQPSGDLVVTPIPDLARRGGAAVALDVAESGTAARLLLGALAGFDREFLLDGAPALRRRPMRRITTPLARMGVRFRDGESDGLPLRFRGASALRPIRHTSEVASAQVKSALLLAALAAGGRSEIREPIPSRDHTERMLATFGIELGSESGARIVSGPGSLRAARVTVPGDLSSALYLVVLALLLSGELEIAGVGVNPTRSGGLELLAAMGAIVESIALPPAGREPRADLRVAASVPPRLRGATASSEIFPRLLDDVPILAVAAAFARGATRFSGAGELRVKESDRIAAIGAMLRAFGVRVDELEDGFVVHGEGGGALRAGVVDSAGDHRIAMAATVAALAIPGASRIRGFHCVAKSWPSFRESLIAIGVGAARLRPTD